MAHWDQLGGLRSKRRSAWTELQESKTERCRWQGWARRQPQGGVLLFWEVFTPRSNTVWFESQDHSRSCWKLIAGHEWFIIQAGVWQPVPDTVDWKWEGWGCRRVRCKGRKRTTRASRPEQLEGWPFTGMRKTREAMVSVERTWEVLF